MMVIPFETAPGLYALYVILGRDNLERIEEYDPAVIRTIDLPKKWQSKRMVEVIITQATEEEFAVMMKLAYAGKPKEALKLVTRGFRFRPDMGDHDGPPLNVTPGKEGNTQ